jgi:integrase/recombinase XerD
MGALVLPLMAASRRSSDRALLRDRPAQSVATKQAAVVNADEVAALIDCASPRDAALIALMAAGAMRVGEATLLTWGDVDGCVVTIPGGITKTCMGRSLTLPDQACKLLNQWRQLCPPTRTGWVFPGLRGQCLSVRAAQTAISKLAATVGVDGVSSHSFRRSALTAAHEAGLSLKAVAEISGHKSIGALERYLDQGVAKEKAEEARGLLFASLWKVRVTLLPLKSRGSVRTSKKKPQSDNGRFLRWASAGILFLESGQKISSFAFLYFHPLE